MLVSRQHVHLPELYCLFTPLTPFPIATDRFKIALYKLWVLDAIDVQSLLTAKGRDIVDLSTEPGLAVALLKSVDLGCLDYMLTLAAMLTASESSNLFSVPPGCEPEAEAMRWDLRVFYDSDHMDMIVLYADYDSQSPHKRNRWCRDRYVNAKVMEAAAVERKRLLGFFPYNVPVSRPEYSTELFKSIMDCLLAGYPAQIAQRDNIQSDAFDCTPVMSGFVHVEAKIPWTSSAGKRHAPATVLYHSLQQSSNGAYKTALFRTVSMLSPL